MVLRPFFLIFLLSGIPAGSLPHQTVLKIASLGDDPSSGHALARLTSWVLFGGGRVARGAPFLAYGYLSQVESLSQAQAQPENESSALLTFVIEGTVVDFQQNAPALMLESEGTLRIFFDPQAKRDFAQPESFRSGKEVAKYNLRRKVLFNPDGGWLYDRSFASLISSQSFAFKDTEVDLLRLWGAQLAIRAQARVGDGLPSPLPEYTGAIPYLGQLFVDGERTDRVPSPEPETVCLDCKHERGKDRLLIRVNNSPFPFSTERRDSFAREQSWD